MTYQEALRRSRDELEKAGVPSPRTDAELLLLHVCGWDRTRYLLMMNEEMREDLRERYEGLTALRARRIPLQHITGTACFMGFDFKVTGDVLIPRPDTEILVFQAQDFLAEISGGSDLRSGGRSDLCSGGRECPGEGRCPDIGESGGSPAGTGVSVLDLCTGSGCIAVSLKKICPAAQVTGSDLSAAALAVAGENGRTLGADVEWVQSDLFEKLPGRFHLIVSNPPYIPCDEIDGLDKEVRGYDPRSALDGGPDGLSFYRRIIPGSREHLHEGGCLMVEIGAGQGEDVLRMFEDAGFSMVRICRDLAGLDRVVTGRWR